MSLTLVTSSRARLRPAYLYLPAPKNSVHQNARAHEERRCGQENRCDRRTTTLGDLLHGLFDLRCHFLHFFLRAFPRFLELLHSLLHVGPRFLQARLGLIQCCLSFRSLHVFLSLLHTVLSLLHYLLHVLPCAAAAGGTITTMATRAAITK